ncbi:MAG TPA: hypothetical protein VEC11_04870 [Allosphingosinicella sp.]|nr:hypothetical protein [Allosphingosinicella sp.]
MTDSTETGGAASDRKDVRTFFSVRIRKVPDKRGVNWTLVWIIAGIAAVLGLGGGFGGFFLLGLLGFGLGIFIDRKVAAGEIQEVTGENEVNEEKLRSLAEVTRRVQAADRTKAILRVFDRTQIDRDKLRVLDHVYIFEGEEQLLENEQHERKLGDLINKSIQFVTPARGGKSFHPDDGWQAVKWPDGKVEHFFNPIRLVVLFLSETQLVICDVEIDSAEGSLREEIQRVSLAKIVNLHFVAERTRYPLKRADIIKRAEQLNFDKEAIEEMKRAPDSEIENDWKLEMLTSRLTVSRTDAGAITMPIRSQLYFGKHLSALDDDDSLGDVEVKIDRMINELNRLVETY